MTWDVESWLPQALANDHPSALDGMVCWNSVFQNDRFQQFVMEMLKTPGDIILSETQVVDKHNLTV